MGTQKRTGAQLISFAAVLMVAWMWDGSSAALQFEIDPGSSIFELSIGLGEPPPPGPLSGIIEIALDPVADTGTLLSLKVVPASVLDGFQSQLDWLIGIPAPISSEGRFVVRVPLGLGPLDTADFFLDGDRLVFDVQFLSRTLVDGPGVTMTGTASLIPEPSTALLIGIGLVALGVRRGVGE